MYIKSMWRRPLTEYHTVYTTLQIKHDLLLLFKVVTLVLGIVVQVSSSNIRVDDDGQVVHQYGYFSRLQVVQGISLVVERLFVDDHRVRGQTLHIVSSHRVILDEICHFVHVGVVHRVEIIQNVQSRSVRILVDFSQNVLRPVPRDADWFTSVTD